MKNAKNKTSSGKYGKRGGRGEKGKSTGKEKSAVYLYGRHALVEALKNKPKAIKKVYLSAEIHEKDKEIRHLLQETKIPATKWEMKEISRTVGLNTAHQGVIAVIDPRVMIVDFENFLAGLDKELAAKEKGEEKNKNKKIALVLLDELTDPHNVGAIIRSAAAFGVAGVLLPSHHQAGITGAVIKTSAGMAFRIPLVSIGNINHTVRLLKERGFWTYALAMDGVQSVEQEKFDAPALFIVGNEGRGIRQKTMEHTDVALRIPMDPRCESLNAAVSAAIVLYEWSKGKK